MHSLRGRKQLGARPKRNAFAEQLFLYDGSIFPENPQELFHYGRLWDDVLKRAKFNIRSVGGEVRIADPSTIRTGTQLMIQNIAVDRKQNQI